MAKLILDPIGSMTQSAVGTINNNLNKIEAAVENTLSRDGSTPNHMNADLDMNGNDVLNAGLIMTDTLVVGGTLIPPVKPVPIDMPFYDTVLMASLAHIKPHVRTISTGGYKSPGDGGAALYKRVTSEPSHAGKFKSVDGSWWELAEQPIYVEMFGAGPNRPSADNTKAFEAAAQFLDEGDTLYCHGVTYPLLGPVNLKPVLIAGENSTVFEFDNTGGAKDGFVFATPTKRMIGYGVLNATIRTIGGHGRDAISTSKAAHNDLQTNIQVEFVNFCSEDTDAIDDSFAQKWGWRWCLHLGDAWNVTISAIDAVGSYVTEVDPAAQFLDGFLRTDPAQGILSLRMSNVTTHNIAKCFEIRQKTYWSMHNVDFARAWKGIYDAPDRVFETNRYAYGEASLNFVVINAQKACVDLKNRFFTNFNHVACHRTADAFDHGEAWYGIRLDDAWSCQMTSIEIWAPAAMPGENYGLVLAGGIGNSVSNVALGGPLSSGIRLSGRLSDNSANQGTLISNVTLHSNITGTVFDLAEARGARVTGFTKQGSISYGTFVTYGNLATQQQCFFLQAPVDNSLEFDDDFFWVRPNGGTNAKRWRWNATDTSLNLATQADNFGVGENAILISRSGVEVTKLELRGDVVQIGGAGSGNVARVGYCPEYPDNATAQAAGLPNGALYRQGDNVCIVHD